MPLILDGRSLAARRLPEIARRAAAVAGRRGRPPHLLLLAFADADGHVAHVKGKQRACAAAGIDVTTVVVQHDTDTATAVRQLTDAIAARAPDGVFVQIPASPYVDEAALCKAIPAALDVDLMHPSSVDAYLDDPSLPPPVTVGAALLLLEPVMRPSMRGVLVAEPSPFATMFLTALQRAGIDMRQVTSPDAAAESFAGADVVVVALARADAVEAATLPNGAIAIDVGYYNEGGAGDIRGAADATHLAALAPVPGGIGPMTVSALLERTVTFAERS